MSLTSLTLDDGLNCAFRFCRTMKRYEEEFRGVRVFARARTHTHTLTHRYWYYDLSWVPDIYIYIYIYACLTVSKSVPVAGSEDLVFLNVFATIHFWIFLGVPKFQYHVCVFGSELYTTILVLFATYWKPQ